MIALKSLTEAERKSALRQAILRRAPGISSDHLNSICESVNTKRHYIIKCTTNQQKFLNLVTRETIITEEHRGFTEVVPLYGQFQCPYFEKTGETRISRNGELAPSVPAAAVKIHVGSVRQRASATYTLILYLPARANHRMTF